MKTKRVKKGPNRWVVWGDIKLVSRQGPETRRVAEKERNPKGHLGTQLKTPRNAFFWGN